MSIRGLNHLVQRGQKLNQVEHIKPCQADGETTLENLAWSCFGCNSHKHIKTFGTDPIAGQKEPLFNPRQQSWNEHFSWSTDFAEVIGITPCGRATVEALRLKRLGVVNLRHHEVNYY